MGVNVGVEDPFIEPLPVGFEPSPETPMIGGLGGGGCSSSNPNCRRCFLDGFEIDCERAMFLADVGSALRCPNNDCGARIQTVTAYGRDGRVLGSTSRIILPGEFGWDGSLDSRYRRGEVREGEFSILWGGGIFNRVSGGGSSDVFFGRGRTQQTPQNTGRERTTVPAEDINAYRARIETMLQEKRCRDFLEKLLYEVKERTGRSYKGLVDAFNDITFYYAYTGAHGGYAKFEHGKRVAEIDNTIKTEKFVSADRSAFLIANTTGNIVGETLHHIDGSGPYSIYRDADYARAYNAIRVREGTDIPRNFSSNTYAEADRASNYWHTSVGQYCTYPRK
jgi:hypothetical protein